MRKYILLGVAIGVVAGGAFLWYRGDRTPVSEQNDRVKQYSWDIQETGAGESTGTPRTTVSLRIGGDDVRTIGTYDGSCIEIDASAWTLMEHETGGVICWWAGGGHEIGIFQNGTTTEVKVGDLDEGSEEVSGFRGNFKTVLTL